MKLLTIYVMGEKTYHEEKMRTPNETYIEKISTPKYELNVETKSRYWEGEPGGKMEDMPGTFLESKITLLDIRKPSPLEALALSYVPLTMFEYKREITYQPKGYARLYHDDLLEKVKTNPGYYVSNLRGKVKKLL